MGTVIRFPIERRDFGITRLPEGLSAVLIPFPARRGQAAAAQQLDCRAPCANSVRAEL